MITKVALGLKEHGLKIILWIIIVSFVGAAVLSSLFKSQNGITPQAMFTVNGYPIDRATFQQKVAHERDRLESIRSQLGPQADALLQLMGLSDPSQAAMSSIISEKLLDQVAYQIGITISPMYIMQKLQDPSFVIRELSDVIPLSVIDRSGHVDMFALKNYLRSTRQTMQQFEELVEDKLRREQLLEILGLTVTILPEEVRDAYKKSFLARSYSILKIPFEASLTMIRKKGFSDEDLSGFYQEQNAKNRAYWSPEKRSAEEITFDAASYGITISPQDIDKFYQQHKQTFVEQPAMMQVRRILVKVPENASSEEVQTKEARARALHQQAKEDPSKFAEIAKRESEDVKTASKGGLTDFFVKGSQGMEQRAFRLANDGDISEVLSTDEGFEILQRVARKAVVYKPLIDVASIIENRLRAQQFQSAFNADMSRFVYGEKADERLKDLMLKKGGSSKTIEGVIKDDSMRSKKLFAARLGQWVFYIDKDKGYALKLKSIEKSAPIPLADIKKQVSEDYFHKEARKAAQADLRHAQELAKTLSLEKVQEKVNGTIQKIELITPEDLKKKYDALLPVREMTDISKVGMVATAEDANGYVIIKVNEVAPLDEVHFSSQAREVERELYQSRLSTTIRSFVASLYRNATINVMNSTIDA